MNVIVAYSSDLVIVINRKLFKYRKILKISRKMLKFASILININVGFYLGRALWYLFRDGHCYAIRMSLWQKETEIL